MRASIAIAVAFLLGLAAARVSYEGHKVYQLTPTPSQAKVLEELSHAPGHIPWSSHARTGRPYSIQVAPKLQSIFVHTFEKLGAKPEVIIEDVERVFAEERLSQSLAPKAEGRISFDKYNRHDEINAYLDELQSKYSSLISLESVGTTFENRDMKLIKISKRSPGVNPVIFIDAGIHAREWIAPAQALYVISQLVENSTNSYLLNDIDWYILPVVNPDGYEFAHTDDRMWRKTRSNLMSSTCPGIDANRNYGHHWGEGGTSNNPCSEIYRGPRAFSEQETTNMRDYLAKTKNIQLYLTLHSFGEYLLYPWSYTPTMPDNWEDLERLAHLADDAQAAAGGNHYTIGQSTVLFGETAGSADDWAMGGADIPMAFTIELPGGGSTGFDMPASRIKSVVIPFFEAFRAIGEDFQSRRHKQ